MVTNERFDLFIQIVIILNIVPIAIDLAHNETWNNDEQWLLGLEV